MSTKRNIFMGTAATGIVALVLVGYLLSRSSASNTHRPLRLVITGAAGERFSGKYVADGKTNLISAIAPASISLQAGELAYEFERAGKDGEFRVAAYVGDLCRTSATSDARKGVRGGWRSAADSESYWAGSY